MASAAQVLANRLNAQKSTGPRTPEGKGVVARNAVKHGLLAREVVIKGEDPGEFEFYRDQMLGELAPVGQMESMLVERIVSLSWRLQRAERLQNGAFDSMYLKEATCDYGKMIRAQMSKGVEDRPEADAGDLVSGLVVVADFANYKVLDRMLLYERRIEHSLYRTMAELQRLRVLRELEPATAKPTREAGSAVGRASAEVSSVKFEVSSEKRLTSSLPTSHFKPDTSNCPPSGVTTNATDAEGQLCETKPICADSNEDQVPCGTGIMNDSAQEGLGKTKPISPGEAGGNPLSPPPPEADRTGWGRGQSESWFEQANVV